MMKIRACLKNVPVPLAFAAGLLSMLVVAGVFWLAGRSAGEEAVFWQAVDNNLNSRSLVLETEVSVPVHKGEATVLSSRLGFNFAPEPSFGWRQSTLFYDRGLADAYGLGSQPGAQATWYEQAACGAGAGVSLYHDLRAETPQPGWNDYLDGLDIRPPLGQATAEPAASPEESLQHFMMYSLANGGILLYGKLPPAERREIVDQLRKAYSVDFENVRTVRSGGRLLYEYDVAVDSEFFGPAFVDYFNANLPDPARRLHLPDDEAAGSGRGVSHTVAVDVFSRQITEVRHPLELNYDRILDAQTSGVLPAGQFNVIPYYSELIDYLLFGAGADVRVVTKVLNRDQRVDAGLVAGDPRLPGVPAGFDSSSSPPSGRIGECQ